MVVVKVVIVEVVDFKDAVSSCSGVVKGSASCDDTDSKGNKRE